MTRFHNIRCNKYISKKHLELYCWSRKKILIVFGQWAFHVSLKKLGLLAMLRSGSVIFEKDFKQCQYRVQKACIIPQMRNSKSKLIKLIVEKHFWLQLMLGIWRCCCRWVEKKSLLCTDHFAIDTWYVHLKKNSKVMSFWRPKTALPHCHGSVDGIPAHLRVLAKAIPSAKLKGEVIQKAAQMRQSSGSLLHASSLNRQQQKSPTTIGNHELPSVLRGEFTQYV